VLNPFPGSLLEVSLSILCSLVTPLNAVIPNLRRELLAWKKRCAEVEARLEVAMASSVTHVSCTRTTTCGGEAGPRQPLESEIRVGPGSSSDTNEEGR
jgi:hypothetical protein